MQVLNFGYLIMITQTHGRVTGLNFGPELKDIVSGGHFQTAYSEMFIDPGICNTIHLNSSNVIHVTLRLMSDLFITLL